MGLWCLLLWIFQFVTLAKFSRVLEANTFFGSFGNFTAYLSNPNFPVQLDGLDEFLGILLIGIPIYLVYLQARFRVLEGSWKIIGSSTWKKILFLSVLFATFCRFILHPYEFPMLGDTVYDVAGVAEFWRSIKMGAFADYSTMFYSGWNCRQYYGNLFYILSGTFAFLTNSHFGIKLFLLVAHVASGLGMFLWIEKLTRSRYAAFFAGTAFCLNYWHFHQIFVTGQLHVSIVYACLPWPFYFFERGLTESKSRLRNFLLCAIPLAVTVYSHFVWGTMLWGLFTVYSVYRLATRLSRMERTWAFSSFAFSFSLEVLILAGLITAPIIQKKESFAYYSTRNFNAVETGPTKRIHPNVLYQWYNGHWSIGERLPASWYNSYLGLIPLLLAILGLLGMSRKYGLDSNALKIISLFMLGSLALVFFYFELIKIPGLSIFRIFPDHRYQTFLVFFIAAGSAFGVLVWRYWSNTVFSGGWKKNLWGVLPLLLLAIDVGSTSFQFPFQPPESRFDLNLWERYKTESKNYLDKHENVPYYLFFEGSYTAQYCGRIPGLKAIFLGMPSDQGVQQQTGSRQSMFGNTFYSWLATDFKQPHVFPDSFTLNYFYLNNFRYVMLFENSARIFDSTRLQDFETAQSFVHAQLRHHTPIIASSMVESYEWKNEEDPLELQRLYSNMGLDYEHATAGKIFVQPHVSLESLPATGRPILELLDYKVYPKKYFYRIRLNQPAYVRLAASYYSFLTVRLDGQKTPFYPGATYEVVMKVPAGEHVIEVEGGWDPYRKVWLYITWIAFVVLGYLAIRHPSGVWKNRSDR